MGLCFGKDRSTDGRSSTIQRKPPAQNSPGTSRITTPGQTFQELLARKAEEAFEPGPSSAFFRCREESPLTKTEVWRGPTSGFRSHERLRDVLHARPRRAEDFPVFQTHDESSGEMTILESPEYNSPRSDTESFSSFRNGSLETVSIYEDVDVGAVAPVVGNATPVYPGKFKMKGSSSSSREIVEETGSDSSMTNDIFSRESSTSVTDDRPMEKVIMVDSRSGSQDVMSLEFLEEFCRISEVTSQESSCSEADPKEVLVQDSGVVQDGTMSSCTRYTRYMSSSTETSGEYKRVELSFVDFLCSQSQAQLSSSPGSSNKKRQSTSEGETMSESMTKKPRFSPEQEVDVEEINGFMKAMVISSSCSTSEQNSTGSLRRISFTVAENESRISITPSPSLKVPPLDDHPKHRHRNYSTDKTPPSTPGSFRSTPFASVGSSFSMEEISFRKSLSPCTPLSAASFTSAGVLSPDEMTAIWSAFQDAQSVQ